MPVVMRTSALTTAELSRHSSNCNEPSNPRRFSVQMSVLSFDETKIMVSLTPETLLKVAQGVIACETLDSAYLRAYFYANFPTSFLFAPYG